MINDGVDVADATSVTDFYGDHAPASTNTVFVNLLLDTNCSSACLSVSTPVLCIT